MAPLWILFFFTLLLCSLIHLYLLLSRSKKGVNGAKSLPLPPGPKGLPVLGNLHQFGPKPHRTIHNFSKVYGPLMRIRFGTCEVAVVSSPAVAEQIFRVHDVNFSYRPQTAIGEHLAFNYQDLAFAPYGPRWRMLRKLLALHLFAPKPLNDLRGVRESEASLLAHSLYDRANCSAPLDLGQAVNVCVTNALSRSMFSQSIFGYEISSGATEFKDMVVEFMRLCGVFFVSDFVPALRWVDVHGQSVIRQMKRLQRRFELFFDKVIQKHSVAGQEGDLLTALMKLKEEGGVVDGVKLTDTAIKALLLDLFTAGTDTSSATIEWAISEMIRHPDLLRRAQEEVESLVGRDRLVCESDLPNLPLLQAIIKETLRLHPPAPLSVPRISLEPCEVNGYLILKDTTVLLNIWALGRDPTLWPSPLEFRPERFLPGGGHEHIDVKGNDFEVLPFGAGRRICVGLNMGMKVVQLLTATLVHAFDWTLPQGQTPEKLDMEEAYGMTLQREVPLMVHPIPRLPKQAYEICY